MSEDKEYIYCFQKGKHSVLTFNYPETADYERAPFSSYKITYNATLCTYYKSYVDNIQISSNIGSNNDVIAECVNTSSKNIDIAQLTCIYYQGGKIVGESYDIELDLPSGNSTMITFDSPYDENYENIAYDNYKIYIDCAYII